MTTQLPHIDVIVNPEPVAETWRTVPRELEAEGFHGVLCPDNPWSADPFQILAIAASVTSTLQVGSHVLAAPLRQPSEVVDQTRSVVALSGGRFGLGLGTGLPVIHEHAQRAGRPAMNGQASRSWIATTARAVRAAATGPLHITVAAGGPKSLAVAAEFADEVALAIRPTATADDIRRMVDTANSVAAQHDRTIGFVINPIGVGDRLVGFLAGDASAAQLREAGVFALLPDGPDAIAQTLADWRAEFGITRVVASAELREELAAALHAV